MWSIIFGDFSKAAIQKKIFFFLLISLSLKGWNFVLRPLNDPKGKKTLSRIAAIAGWRESCFSTDILQYLTTSWRFCWTKGRTYLQRWKMLPLKEGYRKNSEHGWKNATESLIRRWDLWKDFWKTCFYAPWPGGGGEGRKKQNFFNIWESRHLCWKSRKITTLF